MLDKYVNRTVGCRLAALAICIYSTGMPVVYGEERPNQRTEEYTDLYMQNLHFRVLQRYIDIRDGFQKIQGYLRLRVFLPDLDSALSQIGTGSSDHNDAIVTVMPFDIHFRVSSSFLDTIISNNQKYFGDKTGSYETGFDSEFYHYHDLLNRLDIFILKGSNPLFIMGCSKYIPIYLPFRSCSVRQKLFGNLLVEYRYDRVFIKYGIMEAIAIDNGVKSLVASFVVPMPTNN